MGGLSKGRLLPRSWAAASFISNKKRNAETGKAAKNCVAGYGRPRSISVGGGFGGGVHAVLGDLVDAAGGRLDALAVEMIERDVALTNGVAFFDGFGDVSFGERRSFKKSAGGGQLRSDGGRKGAASSVRVVRFHPVAAKLNHLGAVEENVDGAFHVSAFDDDGASAHLDNFARGGFHIRDFLDGHAG